jgi:uncharacterized membrane protein
MVEHLLAALLYQEQAARATVAAGRLLLLQAEAVSRLAIAATCAAYAYSSKQQLYVCHVKFELMAVGIGFKHV